MKFLYKLFVRRPFANFMLLISITISLGLITVVFAMILSSLQIMIISQPLVDKNSYYLQTLAAEIIDESVVEMLENKYGNSISVHRIYHSSTTINSKEYTIISYPEEIISMMGLNIIKGKLPEGNKEIVVLEGTAAVGDKINLEIHDISVTVRVSGIMKKSSYYVRNTASSTEVGLGEIYIFNNIERIDYLNMIVVNDDFVTEEMNFRPDRNLMLLCDDSIHEEELSQTLSAYGMVESFSNMKKTTWNATKFVLEIIGPIAIFSFVLAMSSIISNLLLVFKHSISDMTILYVNGYSLIEIKLIGLVYNALIMLISLLLSVGASRVGYSALNVLVKESLLLYAPAILVGVLMCGLIYVYIGVIINKRSLIQIIHNYKE